MQQYYCIFTMGNICNRNVLTSVVAMSVVVTTLVDLGKIVYSRMKRKVVTLSFPR